ncbi:hypothetical protein [Nocardia sp. NPDC005825]|uniref:hypothetical protein n=1 Tax=unclassified Nocardia TaxID=2637762 RepID=UPI0033E250B5
MQADTAATKVVPATSLSSRRLVLSMSPNIIHWPEPEGTRYVAFRATRVETQRTGDGKTAELISVGSYLKDSGGAFVPLDEVDFIPSNPRYVEGAIELTINRVPILDKALWDEHPGEPARVRGHDGFDPG